MFWGLNTALSAAGTLVELPACAAAPCSGGAAAAGARARLGARAQRRGPAAARRAGGAGPPEPRYHPT
jgi:hypothetical protein